MQPIVFRLRHGLEHDEQESVLKRIRAKREVSDTSCLDLDTIAPEALGICYAYVTESADIEAVLADFSRMPEVEATSLPAERTLIRPR